MAATQLSPVPQSMLSELAMQLSGPQAIPAAQRSQYLADALRALQQTGGENLRTPMALGSNLLADALLMHGRNSSNQALLSQIRQGQGNMAGMAQQGIYAPSAADAGPTGQGLSIGGAPGGSPPAPASAAPVSNSSLADALDPQTQADAANMVYGEARGEPTAGRQAVLGVAQNRAKLEGLTPSDGTGGLSGALDPTTGQPWAAQSPLSQVIREPHQFAGFDPGRRLDPNSSIYKSIMADIMPILNGSQANPAGNADHFEGTAIEAARGGAPSWANGTTPTRIGNQDFYSVGFGGQPPLQSPAGGSQPAMAAAPPPAAPGGPAGGGQPYQVASLGPTPPPPSGGAQAGAPGMAPPAAPQGAAGAAPPQGPPTGPYATPQEAEFIKEHLSYPQGSAMWMAGLQKAQEVQQRRMTPMAPPTGYHWGADGKPVSDLQFTDVPGAQNAYTQRGPNNEIHVTANPAYGTVPGGTVLGAGATVSPMGGTQPVQLISQADRAAHGIQPTDRNGYAVGPDGKVIKTADDPMGPAAQLDYSSKIMEMEPYKNYVGARQNLTAMQQLMTQKGGFSDLALLENGGKTINPNIAIRPNMLEAMYGSLSLPDKVMGEISGVINHGGRLSAESRQAVFNAAQANVQSHWDALQPILGKVDRDATKFGLTRADFLPDLQPMPTPTSPGYGPATNPGVQPGNGAQPAAGGANRLFPSTSPAQAGAQPPSRAALLEEARRRGLVK